MGQVNKVCCVFYKCVPYSGWSSVYRKITLLVLLVHGVSGVYVHHLGTLLLVLGPYPRNLPLPYKINMVCSIRAGSQALILQNVYHKAITFCRIWAIL